MRRSLRGRLFAYLALAVAVSTVLTVVVAGVLSRRLLQDRIRGTLERQADLVEAAVVEPRVPRGLIQLLATQGIQLLVAGDGEPRGGRLAEALLAQGEDSGSIDVSGREFLYTSRDTPAGRIVLVRETSLGAGEWAPPSAA